MSRRKLNCWEYQECGRAEAGNGSACPAVGSTALDGVNGGRVGGRACWVVTDTLCEGHSSGTFDHKISMCRKCAFYHLVAVEEGLDYVEAESLLRLCGAEPGPGLLDDASVVCQPPGSE